MSNILFKPRAIVAEDEAPSRELLISQLRSLWPELEVCGEAENGLEAKKMIESLRPDCAFLDIKMPGLSGIQLARVTSGICRVVFITAYDQYAVDAFENEAVDYILKPATEDRLKKTIQRLKDQIISNSPVTDMSNIIERLVSKMDSGPQQRYLNWVRVRENKTVRLIPVEKIFFFKASDKYTVVMTRDKEFLVKKTISEFEAELDPVMFFRIHRGTIVNAKFIDRVSFLPSSRGQIILKERPEIHTVSRSYAHLFKQM